MLSGREKAAAILSLLGDELAHKILGYLPEESAVSIISASEKLAVPSREVLLDIVSEFNEYMKNAEKLPPSEEERDQTQEQKKPALQGTPFEIISKSPASKISAALKEERPEIAAYVLSHLPVENIYEILQLLGEKRDAIEARLLSLKDVPLSKELEEKILKSISERLV